MCCASVNDDGAGEGTRTPTSSRTPGPKPGAAASYATPARPPPSLAQPGHLDGHAQRGAGCTVIDALEWGHVVVLPAARDHDVLLARGYPVGRVVPLPAAAPPLHPRVALPGDRLADLGVRLRVQVPGDVPGRDADGAQQRGAQVRDVLADALA